MMNKAFKLAGDVAKLAALSYVTLLVGSAAIIQFGRTQDSFTNLFKQEIE